MTREHLMARLLRALSGKTQEQMAEAIDVHPSLIAQFELGQATPSPEHREKMARAAGISIGDGDELLDQYGALRAAGRWRGEGVEALLTDLNRTLQDQTTRACRHLLSLRPIGGPSPAEDRRRADELWARLEKRSEVARLALVEAADEYQTWALHEKVVALAAQEAARAPEHSAGLEHLARKIAELASRAPETRNSSSAMLTIFLPLSKNPSA